MTNSVDEFFLSEFNAQIEENEHNLEAFKADIISSFKIAIKISIEEVLGIDINDFIMPLGEDLDEFVNNKEEILTKAKDMLMREKLNKKKEELYDLIDIKLDELAKISEKRDNDTITSPLLAGKAKYAKKKMAEEYFNYEINFNKEKIKFISDFFENEAEEIFMEELQGVFEEYN